MNSISPQLKNLTRLILFASLWGSANAWASLAKPQELSFTTKSLRIQYWVKRDHKVKRIETVIYKVLNDEGRNRVGTLSVSYNSYLDKIKILQAKTENGDKITHVGPRQIADKELRDTRVVGFDSTRTKVITFPNVKAGSEIHLQYEVDSSDFELADCWSVHQTFANSYIEKVEIDVHSELPVYRRLNNPDGLFAITDKTAQTDFRIQSTKPINTVLFDEPDDLMLPERTPMIELSTCPDWKSFGRQMILRYAALLNEKMPPDLKTLSSQATKISDPISQLNFILKNLSEKIRYFGDWKRRKGGYIPRPIHQVLKTEYADCKEISLVLTSILRKLGYQADVAFVQRGDRLHLDLGSFEQANSMLFNHAIVRAIRNGKTYWLDGTNPIAFAQGIPNDIVDRPAFILSSRGGFLDQIPARKPEDQTYIQRQTVHLSDDQSQVQVGGTVQTNDLATFVQLVSESRYSQATNELNFVKSQVAFPDLLSYHVDGMDKRQKTASTVTRGYSAQIRSFIFQTNKGKAFPIFSRSSIDRVINRMSYQVGDLILSDPVVMDSQVSFEGIRADHLDAFDCQVSSPWMDLERKFSAPASNVDLRERIVIKNRVIPATEVTTERFKKFQSEVTNCFSRRLLIFDKRG